MQWRIVFSIPKAGHDDRKTASRKGADCDVVFDGRQFGSRGKNSHVVQLVQEELLVLLAGRIVRWEEADPVSQLANGLRGYYQLLERGIIGFDMDSARNSACQTYAA